MNKYAKGIIGTLIILVPAVLLLGFLLSKLSGRSFYDNSGAVNVNGIKANVKIYSDDYGVPHILASNNDDMYFALGYMHAQDRLWQMDLTRRVAEGKLSEIFGSSTIDFDILYRTIGINRFAYRWFEKLNPESKNILINYSNGINSFIDLHRENMPVEFDILNYRPEYWKPEHSLMVTRMMAWELNLAWFTDYILGEMINKAGIEKISEIFPDTTVSIFEKPPEIIDSTAGDTTKELSLHPVQHINGLGSAFFNSYKNYRDFFNINGSHVGSNSWVIAGSKSETGKPLLANDPHLAFMAPSKWYEVHLNSNLIDAVGMTIPGTPGIAIGHNRSISWGLTNLMNDDTDFLILEKSPGSANGYKYLNRDFRLDSLKEKIMVKDSNEIEIIVKNTVTGPVISELPTRGFVSNSDKNYYNDRILTFKWTGFEFSDEIGAFYKINKAKNWDEFREGLKEFGSPALNFLYADTSGNIGYKAAGMIPLRRTDNKNGPIFPSSANLEWIGFVNNEELPETFNPKDSFIITANTNPFDWMKTELNNRYYISYIWEPASRIDRVREVLSGGFKFNVNEFKIIQSSYLSVYARELTEYILNSFKDFQNPDSILSGSLLKLKQSGGEMPPGDQTGAIYNTFFVELLKNIYLDELGEDIFSDFLMIPNFPFRSTFILLKNYKQDNPLWFDNINTPQKETRDEIIRKSFLTALNFLKTKFGTTDMNLWRWGEIHKASFTHPLGIVPELSRTFNIGPFEVGGDQTAVNNSEYSLNSAVKKGTFDNILGPSMRMVVNLSDLNRTYSVNSTGQNGQPLHPNYADQTRLWLNGDTKVVVMNESDMLENGYNLLTLIPEN